MWEKLFYTFYCFFAYNVQKQENMSGRRERKSVKKSVPYSWHW